VLPIRQTLIGVVLAGLAALWLARMFKKQIGGYTGDCLGATQQFSEVAFYCGLLCRFS
jgi:adenosylcobinamide-GDP ribazoletransferase